MTVVRPAVFVDTWFWVAALNPRDQAHPLAVALTKRIRGRVKITSDLVLTEVLNHFGEYGSFWRGKASTLVRQLASQNDVIIVAQTRELFDQAHLFYCRYHDKECGLIDCSSFVVMQEHGIREVVTGDEHFSQVGFIKL